MFIPFGFQKTQAGGGGTPADIFIAAVASAGGTLSAGEESAISTFYSSLDSAGIYSKLIQMYTFMGGVAASNAINFINPGTNNLVFNGTWAHSISGSFATQNNANYADTGWNTLTNAGITTASLAYGYQNNQPQITAGNFGYSGNGTGTSNYSILGYEPGGADNFNPTNSKPGVTGGMLNGHSNMMARTSTTNIVYRVANSTATTITPSNSVTWSGSPYNGNLHINNINGANFPAGGRYTFYFIGDGFTQTDLTNLANYLFTLNLSFTNRNL